MAKQSLAMMVFMAMVSEGYAVRVGSKTNTLLVDKIKEKMRSDGTEGTDGSPTQKEFQQFIDDLKQRGEIDQLTDDPKPFSRDEWLRQVGPHHELKDGRWQGIWRGGEGLIKARYDDINRGAFPIVKAQMGESCEQFLGKECDGDLQAFWDDADIVKYVEGYGPYHYDAVSELQHKMSPLFKKKAAEAKKIVVQNVQTQISEVTKSQDEEGVDVARPEPVEGKEGIFNILTQLQKDLKEDSFEVVIRPLKNMLPQSVFEQARVFVDNYIVKAQVKSTCKEMNDGHECSQEMNGLFESLQNCVSDGAVDVAYFKDLQQAMEKFQAQKKVEEQPFDMFGEEDDFFGKLLR